MSDKYVLIGQTPVPVEGLLEWATWFETADRQVKVTRVLDCCTVSTVFMGLDHSFVRFHEPILFETMAFWDADGGFEQERCSTWLEAERQHEAMVRSVSDWRAVLAYCGRLISGWWEHARRDWMRSWKELRGIEPSEFERLLYRMEEDLVQ